MPLVNPKDLKLEDWISWIGSGPMSVQIRSDPIQDPRDSNWILVDIYYPWSDQILPTVLREPVHLDIIPFIGFFRGKKHIIDLDD